MAKVLRILGRPKTFSGKIRLPPSKSYLHRALFVSALTQGSSSIVNCGNSLNEDTLATIECLRKLGRSVKLASKNHGTMSIVSEKPRGESILLNAHASGTTARFLIPFSALTPEGVAVKIVGDKSLRKRPMEAVFGSLAQLGVNCRSVNADGKLPVVVEGGGIRGGQCDIDGSVSSQFISSLLISCVRARNDTTIRIMNPKKLVSKPYILATLKVLSWFGFEVQVHGASGTFAPLRHCRTGSLGDNQCDHAPALFLHDTL